MSRHEQKLAVNEAHFRNVNERLARRRKLPDAEPTRLELICECGDDECTEPITVTVSEYEQARADPTLFLIKHGHAQAERVIATRDGHDLVRKTGEAATIAEELDPRA